MMRIVLLAPMFSLALATACGQKKEFGASVNNQSQSGNVSGQGTDRSVASGTGPASAPVGNPIPEACKTATTNFTKVALLSKSMSTKPMVQSIKYELSSISCKDGKAVPIMNESLFFDLNGTINKGNAGFPAISYVVSDSSSGNLITQGTLEVVEGSDLFGNTGGYAHWKTNTLTYTSTLEKVILEIKLDNIAIAPAAGGNAPSMDSYLRIGPAIPVTQPIMVTY